MNEGAVGLPVGCIHEEVTVTVEHLPTQNTDEQIASALERLSYVMGVLEREQGREHRLSPVQVRILGYLRALEDELCRVSQLARDFGLTQATVSESVAALETRGLITRSTLPKDRRISVLRLTDEGRALAERLNSGIEVLLPHLEQLDRKEKVRLAGSLMKLIRSLHESGVISISRMCVTCGFYRTTTDRAGAEHHFCTLLSEPLSEDQLRVDCKEYKAG